MWGVDHGASIARFGSGGVFRAAMEDRACPSYEAGLDACDLFAQQCCGEARAGRVLRRRCRSEGVERSPYDTQPMRSADCVIHHRHQQSQQHQTRHHAPPNKSHFTLSVDRPHEDYVPENGDYLMAHQPNMYFGCNTAKTKLKRNSPTRPLLVTTMSNTKLDDRLPKVEELLEKVDHEMTEVTMAKQPLKSILNNPLPKSPPQGILKKPKMKSFLDVQKTNMEGRRRQRAASESDQLFCHALPTPNLDSRIPYMSPTMKRAKDNSGTGYSYGTAIASFTSQSPTRSPMHRNSPTRCSCKETMRTAQKGESHVKLLRTTAINNAMADSLQNILMPRSVSPTPACPTVSPALPVSSETDVPMVKSSKALRKKKSKKMTKVKSSKKQDDGAELDDAHSRSPSPDDYTAWHMETDTLMAAVVNMEQHPSPMQHQKVLECGSVTQLSAKLTNGAVVTPRKPVSKEKLGKDLTVAALHTTNPFKSIPTQKESVMCFRDVPTNCLRPSLFPRVPPYLKFVNHDDTAILKVPIAIQKHLKWKLTTITPIVVKRTLVNSGFKLVKSECDTSECPQEETVDWVGIWGKHMKSLMFRAIKDGQKMNHFPGTFQIGRKDRLWRNLQKLVVRFGLKEFGIMPKTYVLPLDMKLLKHDWEKHAANNEKWIIKPPASARGTGIKVVSRWTQIPKKRPVVVQRYVSKPYLINGNKFDMRLYVLVTSIHPLRIYLYKDGLARFASVKYNDEIASLHDKYMHLTNYSINRLSKNYTPNEDFAACEGHKWTLQTLFQYLKKEKQVNIEALWESMKDLVIKTIISGESSISSLTKANITSRYNCYELFGIDVLLDEDLKPWLLEVNISPSLHSASPLDIHVKGPLVTAVLNLAQFQVPTRTNLESLNKEKAHKMGGLLYDTRLYTVYLSKEERDKHIIYTNMDDRDMYLRDILSTLTSDDVRHLIQAEDELTQGGSMERIFPTRDTHKYLSFLSGPRYYNRLFDAWESRYGQNREPGLDLLRSLCDMSYHLEVPPMPLKNDVDAPTPPASERPSVVSLEMAAGPRLCGDAMQVAPLAPAALEPRA